MLALYAQESLLRKNKRSILIPVIRCVIRSAQPILPQRGCIHRASRQPQQNWRQKLNVPVVVFMLLREPEAHHRPRKTVQIVAARRLKPVPHFVSFAHAAAERHVSDFDWLRSGLL